MTLTGWQVLRWSAADLRLPEAAGAEDGLRSALAFGNFDGVHVGHRAIIDLLRARAAVHGGLRVTVLTFEPHPLALLRPELAPAAIEPLSCRLARLRSLGVDRVVVLRFDDALRNMGASEFASALMQRLGARSVVVSGDSRFGAGGVGDAALLGRVAAAFGSEVLQIPAVSRDGRAVSSSRIRRAVEAGDVAAAWRWLDRPFCLHGEVVHGDKRGRTLGFPTANLRTTGQVRPLPGVYAGYLQWRGRLFDTVANFGVRPTLGGQDWRVEAHVLGFDADLYGSEVGLHLVARVRPEQRFAGLVELRAAIAADAAQAAALLATHRACGLRPAVGPT